jgi:TM2 domain-containing membrane protein YozV
MNCAVHTDAPATAYCRTCGKALCENCKRDVMGAIYCEPCIAVRLQGAQAVPPPPPPGTPVATVPGAPSPGIAMLLGFIPGVGAMYNGQFMKGFIHVVIFVMLIIGTDYHWAFGLMIGFFVLYMAFDAYKTAEAKRLGFALPDALGLNRLFGLQEGHSTPAAVPATTAVPDLPAPPARNEPAGAVVLIVLGVVFLLTTMGHLSMHKLWPVFLIGVGFWIAYKRTTVRG